MGSSEYASLTYPLTIKPCALPDKKEKIKIIVVMKPLIALGRMQNKDKA
jgi:hypothetical protein